MHKKLFFCVLLLPVLAFLLPPLFPQAVRTFPVHVSVLCGRERVVAAATPENIAAQIRMLNEHFHGAAGEQIARFELRSISTYDQIKNSHCQNIIRRANSPVHTAGSSDVYSGSVGICTDPKVFDPGAINMFIIDTWSRDKGWESQTSFGNVHSYQPYIALDWSWVRKDSPWPIPIIVHEMGHAFFLHDEKTKGDNVMEGGAHSEYFRPDQVETILKSAIEIEKNLTAYDPQNLILNPGFEAGTAYWTFTKRNFSERFAYSGRLSAELLPGQSISQTIHITRAGIYRFEVMAQAYKTGSSIRIAVNGKVEQDLAILPGGNKDYRALAADELALKASDKVDIQVVSPYVSRVDNFSLKWLR